MTAVLVGATLWVAATIVAPALLMRGHWWIEHPATALRGWYAALATGLAGVAIAVAGVLVLLFRERAHARALDALLAEVAVWTCVGLVIAVATRSLALGEAAIRRAHRDREHVHCLTVAATDRVDHVDGCDVVVLASDRCFAFTDGRALAVYVSRALWSRLDEAERRAVVHHERAHVARGHTHLLSIARVAHDCAPWLPASRHLHRATTLLVELAADDAACAHVDRAPVAAALRKLDTAGCVARATRLERARRAEPSTTCSSLLA